MTRLKLAIIKDYHLGIYTTHEVESMFSDPKRQATWFYTPNYYLLDLEQWANMLKLQDDTLFGGLSLNIDPECNESKPTDFCLNLLCFSSRIPKIGGPKIPFFFFQPEVEQLMAK